MTSRTRRGRDERGISVAELMVVVSVLGVVLATLMGVLASMTSNEHMQQAKVNNQEAVRLTLGQLTRDLRGANPLLAAPVVADSATSVEMALGSSAGTQTHVRWWLSGTTLHRSVLTPPDASPTSPRVMLSNVRNGALGLALFRYFSSDGAELELTGPSAVTVGDVATCTARIRIAVVSDADPGPKPFFEETDAEIRNRLPGGLGC